MNCREFRSEWMREPENATLSHIETCDDCIAWIEANFTNDEEVQFMKEYPQPSAQLEDRIMQTIYQAVEPAAPQIGSAPAEMNSPRPRRWSYRYSAFALASAAALMLAFVGYQKLLGPGAGSDNHAGVMNTAMESSPATQPSGGAAASELDPNTSVSVDVGVNNAAMTASGSAEPAMEPEMNLQLQPFALTGDAGTNPAPTEPQTSSKPEPEPATKQQPANTIAQSPGPEQAKQPTAPQRSLIAARGDKASPNPQQKEEKVALADEEAANNIAAIQPPDDAKAAPEEPVTTITAMESAPIAGETPSIAGETPSVAGPPNIIAGKEEITLSTFGDVETAVQASDIPVPTAGNLPNGFALNTISLRYESETSKQVAQVTADYKRNDDWIKIEVTRNEQGKQSLSIPGTFLDTRLFTIDGEQAIAVTYNLQEANPGTSVQHAVHFNTQKGNHSLYVVLTSKGTSLDELIEVAKQTTWKMR